MINANPDKIHATLNELCVELVDLSFALERRGRVDAADIAMVISARLAEVRDECSVEPPPSPRL